jgi:hypothetical protein
MNDKLIAIGLAALQLKEVKDACSATLDASVTVHDLEEGGTHSVTLDTIATGLGRIERGEDGCKMNSEITGAVTLAQRDNDAGGFDAYSADAVMQAGIFDEVIYG